MIKVGVVGRHFGANVHAPALRLAGFEVDGIRSHDWQTFLDDPSVQAISLAVPPFIQVNIAAEAFRRKKHVLLEKPVSANLEKARELLALAKKSRVIAMVDFELPLLKSWTAAKKRIDAGELGRLKAVNITWTTMSFSEGRYEDQWKHDSERGGGMLNNFGPHIFNYLEHFFGRVALLSCQRQFVTHGAISLDLTANLKFKTKEAVPIQVKLDGRGPVPLHRIEIKGELDEIILENKSADYVKGFTGENEAAEQKDGRIWAVHLVAKRFLEAIQTGKSASPSLEEGLRAEELLEEARRA